MKSELEKLIDKWETEIGSFIPNAPIYKAFIDEAKDALEREKKVTNPKTIHVIELDGKFWGHDIVEGQHGKHYGFGRVWHDDIKHAICWNVNKKIPLDRIYCPIEMSDELSKANVIKVKITQTFEIL